jgi:hypothetical protein
MIRVLYEYCANTVVSSEYMMGSCHTRQVRPKALVGSRPGPQHTIHHRHRTKAFAFHIHFNFRLFSSLKKTTDGRNYENSPTIRLSYIVRGFNNRQRRPFSPIVLFLPILSAQQRMDSTSHRAMGDVVVIIRLSSTWDGSARFVRQRRCRDCDLE